VIVDARVDGLFFFATAKERSWPHYGRAARQIAAASAIEMLAVERWTRRISESGMSVRPG
jgi:hypothetical protein